MFNTILTWLNLREDALIGAQKAIDTAKQITVAQQETIERQREYIRLLEEYLGKDIAMKILEGQNVNK